MALTRASCTGVLLLERPGRNLTTRQEVEVYVQLVGWSLDDDVRALFAAKATHMGGDVYRLEAPEDPTEVEHWAFPPGAHVRCERRAVPEVDGVPQRVLVAVERAPAD